MNSSIAIIGKLLVIARALERAGDEIFSSFGITLGMYEILMLIADNVDTTTKLANISQITLASITHKTKHMEDKGYIKRVVSKEDKRVWYFSLTNKGRILLETILAIYEEITVPLFAHFSESYKQQTLTLLTATEEHLRYVLQNRKIIVDYVDKLIEKKGLKLKNKNH
jgi:DNA-binding MarR family transcriptional regulator